MTNAPVFDQTFADTFEQLLVWRRDVRRFKTDPLDRATVRHLIELACLAPSVGNAQPWRFVTVETPARRAVVRQSFERCNQDALMDFRGEQAKLYAQLKLSGLDDAPIHIAVFCDRETPAGHGLGRKTMAETLDYSVVASIHNFWLAARMVGIGVGWVSIIDPVEVTEALEVPDTWHLVAYLCVGYPVEEHDQPELARLGWQHREAPESFILDR
jgi:5,6-dimethylbenzimidazole synthase